MQISRAPKKTRSIPVLYCHPFGRPRNYAFEHHLFTVTITYSASQRKASRSRQWNMCRFRHRDVMGVY
jgi:hypothetical protein